VAIGLSAGSLAVAADVLTHGADVTRVQAAAAAPDFASRVAAAVADVQGIDAVSNGVISASVTSSAPMPLETVEHQKAPDTGYQVGSPLYEKQQRALATQGMFAKVYGLWTGMFSTANLLLYIVAGPLVYIVFVCAFGWLYLRFVRTPEHTDYIPSGNGGSFRYGLFDTTHCMDEHFRICLSAMCCGMFRWADTMSRKKVDIIGFWPAIILIALGIYFSPFTAGLFGVVLLCVGVYARRKLRTIYRLRTSGMTWLEDICVLFWCPCCAIAQEAREVQCTSKA